MSRREAGEALGRLIGEAGEKAARVAGDVGEGAMKVARDKLAKAADVVDDWGWKGGKPGEITGREFIEIVKRYDSAPKGTKRAAATALRQADKKFAEQLGYGNMGRLYPPARMSNSATGDRYNIAKEFSDMQEADIPREWTGKVSKALQKRSKATGNAMLPYSYMPRGTSYVSPPAYKAISESMREMTNDQRETFLAIFPEWEGTLEELATFARKV